VSTLPQKPSSAGQPSPLVAEHCVATGPDFGAQLSGMVEGAAGKMIDQALGQLLAVNDTTPAGEAILKTMASKYKDQLKELAMDPQGTLAKLKAMLVPADPPKSSAAVPLGLATPAGAGVVLIGGTMASARLGDMCAPIPSVPPDAGPFIQGNPTVIINGKPAAGFGHLAIGLSKGTSGTALRFEPTVLMGVATVTDVGIYNKAKAEAAKAGGGAGGAGKQGAAGGNGAAGASKKENGAKPECSQEPKKVEPPPDQTDEATRKDEEGCLPPDAQKRKDDLIKVLNDPNTQPKAHEAALEELYALDKNTLQVACGPHPPTSGEVQSTAQPDNDNNPDRTVGIKVSPTGGILLEGEEKLVDKETQVGPFKLKHEVTEKMAAGLSTDNGYPVPAGTAEISSKQSVSNPLGDEFYLEEKCEATVKPGQADAACEGTVGFKTGFPEGTKVGGYYGYGTKPEADVNTTKDIDEGGSKTEIKIPLPGNREIGFTLETPPKKSNQADK